MNTGASIYKYMQLSYQSAVYKTKEILEDTKLYCTIITTTFNPINVFDLQNRNNML